MLTLTRLTCDDHAAPLGLDDPRPCFAWQFESAERSQRQTAYQVVVLHAPPDADAPQIPVWDSGRVESAASLQVAYAGLPLEARQRYTWMAQVWDQDGQPSGWSTPAFFEMGLLHPGDWQGRWIAHPEASWSEIRPAPHFRKPFILTQAVRRARVYLCGLGYHVFSVNGAPVTDACLSPAFTRYDRRALYITYDITAALQRGENVLGVLLGNGFYNQAARDAWDFEKSPWRASPCFRLQCVIDLDDGSQQILVSDASWKCADGPIRFDATRLGEHYDARLELSDWDNAALPSTAAGWVPARLVEGPRGQLTAQLQPPIRVTQTLPAARVWPVTLPAGGTAQVFDFAQNFAGWARLRISAPRGTQITLRYGERLNADGSADLSNINNLVFEGEVQVDRYICKGGGAETYTPTFTYHGFQYVQVEGAPAPLELDALEGCVAHTDFARAGSFACSNETINRLQTCTEWSYRSNYMGYPTDCPQREKNGWTGDAHLAAEAGLYNFHAETSYARWLTDLSDEQREDGALPGIVPTSGWGYAWGNGPCWDSACILLPWYLYLYRGDRAVLERSYPMIRRYMEYLGEQSHQGELIALGLGDWVPPFGRPEDYTAPLTLVVSSYFALDARISARIADLLGFEADCARYTAWAERLAERIHSRFYDPISALYAGGSQTAQAMPLYAGVTPAEERPRVAHQLVTEIHQQKGRINGGIHGAKAILRALSENGFHNLAYRLITQPLRPGWAWWLSQGATTLWEDWNGEYSRNHIMFGDISAWFYQYLAGIRPDPRDPGFHHILLRPVWVNGLTWARGEYESAYGKIISAWERSAEGWHLSVALPPNTSATVTLPKCSPDTLQMDGAPLEQAGLTATPFRADGAMVEIGSGSWSFTCQRTGAEG